MQRDWAAPVPQPSAPQYRKNAVLYAIKITFEHAKRRLYWLAEAIVRETLDFVAPVSLPALDQKPQI